MRKLGIIVAMFIFAVLCFSGLLIPLLVSLFFAAIIGAIWYKLSESAISDPAGNVRIHLNSGIQWLESLCSKKPSSKGDKGLTDSISSLVRMFGHMPTKRELWEKIQAMKEDLKGLEKMTTDQCRANKLAGVCMGVAFILAPARTLFCIVLYLILRWLFIPRCQSLVK